jgi:2-oxoglutarate dehydrogenase E2 component (dihydrolipoamide succinyltransferase)
MPVDIKAPHFPESIEDGTLMTWYKQAGENVAAEEKIADIETDKIVLDVLAPVAGVLASVVKKQGDTVRDDELLATLEEGAAKSPPKKTKQEKVKEETPQPVAAPEPAPEPEPAAEVVMSPSVRKLVAEHDLDPASIVGTGKHGRITRDDVLSQLEPASAPAAKAEPAPAATPTDGRPQERVPMSRLRARVAERLVQVQQETAMLTTFNEVNMGPVMDLRKRHKDQFEKQYGVKLGFMSFFVKAAIQALKKFPAVNAVIDGRDIIYNGFFDIGIAVSTERGLVVPVLRDANRLSFAEVEAGIGNFATKARENQLSIDDLSGGTFTITNGGIFGSLLSTPILNPPQSAILGMHRIQDRPMAEDGQVVIRPMMYLALSYDHRIVDGRDAVQFLVTIKEALEDPARMLLQV